MLLKVCLLVVLATVVMSAPTTKEPEKQLTLEESWTEFKTKHNKVYPTPEEESNRKEIFKKNLEKINEHNKKYDAGEVTFTQGINAFADLTHEEFKKTHLGLLPVVPVENTDSKKGPLLGSH